jgi:hypothetical protein
VIVDRHTATDTHPLLGPARTDAGVGAALNLVVLRERLPPVVGIAFVDEPIAIIVDAVA